jgi:hypothetical protein
VDSPQIPEQFEFWTTILSNTGGRRPENQYFRTPFQLCWTVWFVKIRYSTYQIQTNDISLVSSYWGAFNDTKTILIRQFCKKLKVKENTKNTATFDTFTCRIENPKKNPRDIFKSFNLSIILNYFTNPKKL